MLRVANNLCFNPCAKTPLSVGLKKQKTALDFLKSNCCFEVGSPTGVQNKPVHLNGMKTTSLGNYVSACRLRQT